MIIQNVVVTGASGMVGRNLLEKFKGTPYAIHAPKSSELDLRRFSDVQEYFENIQPGLVVHCAGRVGGIQANLDAPVEFLLDNADMGRNVILAARNSGVGYLLNLGSSCMYPRNLDIPLKEDFLLTGELEPTNEGYAIAKIFSAKLCEYISKSDPQFKYKTLIPSNLYGPHDKFDESNSHLIPAIIKKIYNAINRQESKVEIWGDGNARREFLYVEDLVSFIVQSVENIERLPNYLNIGLGFDYSILEYYQTVADIMNFNGEFVHDLSRPVGMKRKVVDITLATSVGWKASTGLHEGIKKTVDFFLRTYQ